MFKHRATFTDGPCKGRESTLHSEDGRPPGVVFVYVRADGSRYEVTPDCTAQNPVYTYAGPAAK